LRGQQLHACLIVLQIVQAMEGRWENDCLLFAGTHLRLQNIFNILHAVISICNQPVSFAKTRSGQAVLIALFIK
jgi:hypothetical protein